MYCHIRDSCTATYHIPPLLFHRFWISGFVPSKRKAFAVVRYSFPSAEQTVFVSFCEKEMTRSVNSENYSVNSFRPQPSEWADAHLALITSMRRNRETVAARLYGKWARANLTMLSSFEEQNQSCALPALLGGCAFRKDAVRRRRYAPPIYRWCISAHFIIKKKRPDYSERPLYRYRLNTYCHKYPLLL